MSYKTAFLDIVHTALYERNAVIRKKAQALVPQMLEILRKEAQEAVRISRGDMDEMLRAQGRGGYSHPEPIDLEFPDLSQIPRSERTAGIIADYNNFSDRAQALDAEVDRALAAGIRRGERYNQEYAASGNIWKRLSDAQRRAERGVRNAGNREQSAVSSVWDRMRGRDSQMAGK